jgi:hypothetical protein
MSLWTYGHHNVIHVLSKRLAEIRFWNAKYAGRNCALKDEKNNRSNRATIALKESTCDKRYSLSNGLLCADIVPMQLHRHLCE